jgi:hypothetical protein
LECFEAEAEKLRRKKKKKKLQFWVLLKGKE